MRPVKRPWTRALTCAVVAAAAAAGVGLASAFPTAATPKLGHPPFAAFNPNAKSRFIRVTLQHPSEDFGDRTKIAGTLKFEGTPTRTSSRCCTTTCTAPPSRSWGG